MEEKPVARRSRKRKRKRKRLNACPGLGKSTQMNDLSQLTQFPQVSICAVHQTIS
jgi:hypothetical protein